MDMATVEKHCHALMNVKLVAAIAVAHALLLSLLKSEGQ